MDVHNHLGPGFLEIVYKDALEYEFLQAGITYEREKEYVVKYEGIVLPHKFYADFVVYDKIMNHTLVIKYQEKIYDLLVVKDYSCIRGGSTGKLWRIKIELQKSCFII